jgi:hypothetical protein
MPPYLCQLDGKEETPSAPLKLKLSIEGSQEFENKLKRQVQTEAIRSRQELRCLHPI